MSSVKNHLLASIAYATVLCCVLSIVGIALAKPPATDDTDGKIMLGTPEKVHEAYYTLVNDYETQYGSLTADSSPDAVPTGLIYADTADFNNDNTDELMLTYRTPNMVAPCMEVYRYNANGTTEKIYSGSVSSSSSSGPALYFSKPQSGHHWINIENNSEVFYTINKRGEFVAVKTFETDGKSVFKIDGKAVSQSEYETAYNELAEGRTETLILSSNYDSLYSYLCDKKTVLSGGSFVPSAPNNNSSNDPENTQAQDIPNNNKAQNSTALVSRQYYDEAKGSGGRYAYAIPQINLNSKDARDINAYLAEVYIPLAKQGVQAVRSKGYAEVSKGMDFHFAKNGDVLSVVFYNHAYPEISASDEFEVYNLSVSGGNTVWTNQLISIAGYSQSQYQASLTAAIEKKMYSLYGNAAQGLRIDSFHLNSAVPYMDKNGKLCAAAPVPSAAGADYYWYELELSKTNGKSQTTPVTTKPTTQSLSTYEAQRKLYTDYLTGGGYNKFVQISSSSSWKIQTKMVDLDSDGTYELYIKVSNASSSGPKGPATDSALLRIRGGSVYQACETHHGGGSMGGETYEIYRDSSTGGPVFVRNGNYYDGTSYVNAFLSVYTNINNLDSASHEFETDIYAKSSSLYQDSINEALAKTSYYSDDGDHISFFRANGSYTDSSTYYSKMNRFEANKYSYYSGTYNSPIAPE